jgi:hypothetical protein
LTKQYINSVRDLLGPRAAQAAKPPPDIANKGFESIGAAELSVTDTALAEYEASAHAVATLALLDETAAVAWIGCTPTGPADRACFETFVRGFGRRAFRRPLEDAEALRYLELTASVAARYANAFAGVAYTVAAFLQSPHFLYQVEIGEVDPEQPTRRRLTNYEIAARMSFFLLDTTPSDALLDLADAQGLRTQAEIRAQAEALLASEDAKAALDNYFEERFKLRGLESLTKDPVMFPQWSPALARAMRTESLMLLRDLVWTRNSDIRELLDAPYAFVNRDLADLYGTASVSGDGFVQKTLPAGRLGLLGQGAFLATQAHPTSTSPTRRGRFLSERVLCIDIPPPPPDVVTELPPPIPNMPMTMRERLQMHSEAPVCASCHVRMDGIGLALENFDAVGRFRSFDEGKAIDTTGEIFEVGTFAGPAGFAELARGMAELPRCWVRGLYRHATGHVEAEGDEVALAEVDREFATAEFRLQAALVEIVASDAFRFVDNVVEEGAQP